MTKNEILQKIKKGKVKMRPKVYFALRGVLIALGIIFVTLFVLYLLSFIFFNLRLTGIWYLPRFGFPGLRLLFISSPWALILIAIVLIIILEILVKRFSFAYRRPILYSILAIVIIIFLVSFIIGKTQFHPELFQRAREGHLPIVGDFYQGYGLPGPHDVHHGMISEITDNGFQIEKPDGEVVDIIVTPATNFPSGQDLEKGNMVVVFGKQSDGAMEAFGIVKADNEFRIFIEHRGPRPSQPMPF